MRLGAFFGVTSYAAEGTATGTGASIGTFRVGVEAAAWEGSNFTANNVITPAFTQARTSRIPLMSMASLYPRLTFQRRTYG
jgi:hypothetical protein